MGSFAAVNPFTLTKRVLRIVRRDGLSRTLKKLLLFLACVEDFREELDKRDYHAWIRTNENLNPDAIRRELAGFKLNPRISIIVPVYNVPSAWLDRCIRSVEAQYYENWELCLYDDASISLETIDCLKRWEGKRDRRIKIGYGRRNLHISGASNEALSLATGEFLALLDHDDELSADALFETVKAINQRPDADMLYSDEDKISETGERFAPFFKPCWSPDLILSHMYSGHLGVYRKAIVDRIGGFRSGYEGSQDYDLVLRFTEHTTEDRILHIPRILYHWRTLTASTAKGPESKQYAYESGRKALSACLERRRETARVETADIKGNYRIIRRIDGSPKVSIIVQSRDTAALQICLKGIFRTASYSNMEIVVVGPEGKVDAEVLTMTDGRAIVFIEPSDIGNSTAMALNLGAARCSGEHLLFLHEAMKATEAGWLEAMVGNSQRKETGIVGGMILTEDGSIVSAGLVLHRDKVAVKAFGYYKEDHVPYFGHHHVTRNCSAVPALCLMIEKTLFTELQGFDAEHLPMTYYDVDLCLRSRERGFRILYTPEARFVLHEKGLKDLARDSRDADRESSYIKERWGDCLGKDPFYNPNLSRDGRFNIHTRKTDTI